MPKLTWQHRLYLNFSKSILTLLFSIKSQKAKKEKEFLFDLCFYWGFETLYNRKRIKYMLDIKITASSLFNLSSARQQKTIFLFHPFLSQLVLEVARLLTDPKPLPSYVHLGKSLYHESSALAKYMFNNGTSTNKTSM